MADQLLEDRAHISVYDPKVNETQMLADLDTRAPDDNRNYLQAHSDPYKACEDTHAIAIMTEWDDFPP